MITITYKEPKKRDPLSILLIGPPGGGKTTLAMQFPGVCFIDCDRNLDGPTLYNMGKLPSLKYSYQSVTHNDKLQQIPAHECFDYMIDSIATVGKEPSVQTLVVDSLTFVNEFIIQKVLRAAGKDVMEARDWQPFKSHFLSLLVAKLRGTGKTTICTVHEQRIEQANKKDMMNPDIIGYEPTVQGKIGQFFGGFFTDMWRCTSTPAPMDKLDYILTTCRTSKSDLKNSIGLPATITAKSGEVMFDKLKPFLDKANAI